jgi:hypothetical protein
VTTQYHALHLGLKCHDEMFDNRSNFLYERYARPAGADDSHSFAFDVETLRPGCGMEAVAFENAGSQTWDVWNIWS